MIASVILITLSAMAKAIMDLSSIDHFKNSFWNKSDSWVYKWAVGMPEQETSLWYYLWVFTPKTKERFPYSSTILVFLTDGWHLSQFVFLNALFIGMFLCPSLLMLLVLRIVFGVVFELTYRFTN